MATPSVPPAFKSLSSVLTISKQFAKRDPIISYYSKMYFVQQAIAKSKGDSEAKAYLMTVMMDLEREKKVLKDEDAIKDEEIAQAHIEETALKMFDSADIKDRNSQYSPNLVKVFLVCGELFQILEQFGELSQEVADKKKYSKWKAVDIKRCLDNGITPTPGPPGGWGQDDEDTETPDDTTTLPPAYGFNTGPQDTPPYPGGQPVLPPPPDDFKPIAAPRKNIPSPVVNPRFDHTPSIPPSNPTGASYPTPQPASLPSSGGVVQLSASNISTVQKYCKFAASSLDYEDRSAAVDYLEKALKLLKTGKET